MALYRFPFPSEANQSTWDVRGNWDQNGRAVDPLSNLTGEQAYA
jgi:hypothetical protein